MRRVLVAVGCAAAAFGWGSLIVSPVASTAQEAPTTTTSTTTAPTTTAVPTTTTSTTSTTVTTVAPATTTTTPAPSPAVVPTAVLDSVWAHTPAGSCLVVTEGSRVLYERSPDRPVLPASTLKLLTATAALDRLGADTRLRTSAVTNRTVTGGVLDGNLYLVGGGDPVLGTTAWAAHFTRQPALFTPLERLADAIVASGVHEVRGQIVGDDTHFDEVRRVPSWPVRYTAAGEVGPLSALTVNDGFASWAGSGRTFNDPATGAAQVLTGLLQARGVVVDGGSGRGVHPADASELAGIDSPTVGELVGSMLRESDNGTAELLLKELGRRATGAGTTAAGLDVVRASIGGLGLPTNGVRLIDGSGLGRGNLVTCRLLVALLHRGSPSIEAGLPVAARTGTLYKRFVNTAAAGRLRAKTGSIKGVAALAGHVATTGGRTLTFAYVINNLGSTRVVKPLQETLGNALAGYGA